MCIMGKRNRRRPKTIWRRSTEAEVKQTGMSWNQLEKMAKDGKMEISGRRPMFQLKGLRRRSKSEIQAVASPSNIFHTIQSSGHQQHSDISINHFTLDFPSFQATLAFRVHSPKCYKIN